MVMKVAPFGTRSSIQWPASRPPGRPPDPARKLSGCAPSTRSQAGTSRLSATIAPASACRPTPAGHGREHDERANGLGHRGRIEEQVMVRPPKELPGEIALPGPRPPGKHQAEREGGNHEGDDARGDGQVA